MWAVLVKFHGYRIYGLCFDPPNPKNSIFKTFELKNVIVMHIWKIGSPIPIPTQPTTSLDVWEVWVMFHGYRIYGLRFDPPNPKNLIFESL